MRLKLPILTYSLAAQIGQSFFFFFFCSNVDVLDSSPYLDKKSQSYLKKEEKKTSLEVNLMFSI